MAEPATSFSKTARNPRVVISAVLLANFALAGAVYAATGGKAIAEVWYEWDANSLVGLQALVEKRLDPNPEDPTVYFDIVLPILELPLWFALLAVLLLLDIVPVWVMARRARATAVTGED